MQLKSLGILGLGVVFALSGASLVGCNKQKDTVKGTDKGGATKELSVSAPSSVNIKQGDKAEVKISIERKNMDDAVTVKFDNVPKGVTIDDAGRTITKDKDSATFTFNAAADAALVDDHVVRITTSGGGLTSKTFEMKMDVEKK